MKTKTSTSGTPRRNPATAALLLAFAIVLQGATARGDVIDVQAKPAKGTTFQFGAVQETAFELTNRSQEPIVVMRLIPLDNHGEDSMGLSSGVYGNVRKSKDEDAYVYHRMSQQRSHVPFHGGLLFPGERVVLISLYRPAAASEKFEVAYCALTLKGTGKGGTPDPAIYMPEFKKDSGWTSSRLVPFEHGKWQALAEAHTEIRPLGPGCPERAVLIPELKDDIWSEHVQVSFSFEGSPFTLDQAARAAERITGKSDAESVLAYSQTLGGYVVFEEERPWLLSSAEQASRGQAFPSFPPQMLRDIDSKTHITIRVGEEQQGFGPEVEKSDKTFWERYEVFYGDGMYTRGEFLHIAREEAKDFLALAQQKGATIDVQAYFFKSRYYTLTEKNAPAPPLATQQSP